MVKIHVFFTTVASDIARDMFVAWLDGWGIPWELLTHEDKDYLEELGFIKRDKNSNVCEGDDFRSGDYGILDGSDDIIVLFGDEADIVHGVKICPKTEDQTETVKEIIRDFREIEKVLCK